MLLYTMRRALASVLVLLASSLLVFVLTAATVDPLAQFRTRQPIPPPEFFAAKESGARPGPADLRPLLGLAVRRPHR